LATRYLNNNGLLLLTGAAVPFKEPSPGMLAYALSKTATHSLCLNMAELEELPKDATVATILPYKISIISKLKFNFSETLDTPENRKGMPNADFSKWASLEGVAGLLRMWADGQNRPKNGSFAVLKNVNGTVVPEFI
jgi:dihydropteridine reductase